MIDFNGVGVALLTVLAMSCLVERAGGGRVLSGGGSGHGSLGAHSIRFTAAAVARDDADAVAVDAG